LIIFLIIVVSIGVSLIFFANLGKGGFDFEPSQIITMLLNIIPVSLFKPFVENNMPQLVILAFLTGVALLILGDRVKELNNILQQINQWIMKIMMMVMKLVPVIPFLSIALVIARGNVMELVEGWKFIVASYIVCTIMFVFKLFKASVRTKIPVKEILHKTMPLMTVAFTTSSQDATISQSYDVAEKDFGIKHEFVSFWIPMSTAMFGVKSTVNLTLATMMAAHLCGIPISISFLFVLTILVLELSFAKVGSTAGWVIMFDSFSIPSSYSGLFSTYRLFTDNYVTSAVVGFTMFELLEAADKMNAFESSPSDPQIGSEAGV
jgi:Na+/H+-dicarboxylate symporter